MRRQLSYVPMHKRRRHLETIPESPLKKGERNKAPPQLLEEIMHEISAWRKGQLPKPTTYIPLPVAR